MTRPSNRNGLGLTLSEVEGHVRAIENGMDFLGDSEAVYREWRRIVAQHRVVGVQVQMHGWRQQCMCTRSTIFLP